MVAGTTIQSFKIYNPDTKQEITVEMTILEYIQLRVQMDIAAAIKRLK